MNRRRFLRFASLSSAFIAGCTGNGDSTRSRISPTRAPVDSTPTATPKATGTTAQTDSQSQSETPRENPDTLFVDSQNGSMDGSGTIDDPFGGIQPAVDLASPGQTVYLKPGEYGPGFFTRRSGRPDAPITISGSADALLRGMVNIQHDHIRVRGFSIDGLMNPDRPEDPESYIPVLIHCTPPADSEEYLEDIVCAPTAIGNSRRPLMLFERTKHLEIGPLQVAGLAGAGYVYGDKGGMAGEVVYLGQPLSTVRRESYPWDEIDQTRRAHVHHIDNSAGHPHSELVNTKPGTRDILIEYCTDGGGSHNAEPHGAASMGLAGKNATVRWCNLSNGAGHGLIISGDVEKTISDPDALEVNPAKFGTGHSVYGNRLMGFEREAFLLSSTEPTEQKVICGNNISELYLAPPRSDPEKTEFRANRACPNDIPDGDGIGHAGGESPWSDS